MDVKKFPVPQTGNDVGSQIPNTPFYSCFITRGQYPGGKQCSVIVIRKLLVRAVYDWILVFSVAEDPNLQIIRGQDPGDTAEELIHSDMRIDPVLLFHGTACLRIAVHAERQRRYKQINLAAVPRDLIIKGQRGPGPIDHQFVTRFMLDMHGKLIFRNIILI